MRNFNENTITDAVQDRLTSPTPTRVHDVSAALVRHLHALVREIRPTFAEWETAIKFLTRIGEFCDENRQEFILLSDVLGVSMLVDAINYHAEGRETETTVLGPFFVERAEEYPNGSDISPEISGDALLISGVVCDADGRPLSGATVDIWHSDSEGYYDVQQLEKVDQLAMRGRFKTHDDGRFWCWSIKPAPYPIPHDGPVGDLLKAQGRHPWRPAHVHFMVTADGYEKLVTHIFVAGDPYLDSDVVFGVKDSLIEKLEQRLVGNVRSQTTDRPYWVLNREFRLKCKLDPKGTITG